MLLLFVAMLRAAEVFKFECKFQACTVKLQVGCSLFGGCTCCTVNRGLRAAMPGPFPAEDFAWVTSIATVNYDLPHLLPRKL